MNISHEKAKESMKAALEIYPESMGGIIAFYIMLGFAGEVKEGNFWSLVRNTYNSLKEIGMADETKFN